LKRDFNPLERENIMKTNIGTVERVLRILLGTFVTSLAFWGPETSWAYLGLIFIVTGAIQYCPIWHAAGINTNKKIDVKKI
jgi:hypothetical protein